ncbi:ubiquitin domain-containing protein DSK2 Ecym_4608 [Eremothecium cymbalariae DBVPG|uniref:Ubiquitin-like domain-containing protein n=1 Tax=Eremothecium cymbalariae (strain CBS 270.75 / DBVPG 7215 / KCTC 17166 / NRRL Y-17582) TaxID=931890 RepID=G8JSB5_ERECY|nr:hypothetical protein Ecym_4608 [Eremothecium cymbalariae DBVPG\
MSISLHVKSGQNKWQVSADPSSSIGTLKQRIAEVSHIPAENQRLIYSGKILKDDQTVESYKIADGHSIHLVRSGGGKVSGSSGATGGASGSVEAVGSGGRNSTAGSGSTVPNNITAGQMGGFNPLADLTGARYAGYANLPSTDMFGPDGGLNSAIGQEEILGMLDNPIFQSQVNEMLANPQMIDFLIQQHPHLQAMGPAAREMLQSPFFRQMMTNPDVIRQVSRFQMDMGAANGQSTNDFPAPGSANNSATTSGDNATLTSTGTGTNTNAAAANPLTSLFNAQSNPFAAMFAPPANSGPNPGTNAGATNSTTNPAAAFGADSQQPSRGFSLPPLDPAMLSALLSGGFTATGRQQTEDNRPPEERYQQQLEQLNEMGFVDFDRNVAALRRSGGSVQGALNALLNGDV